MVKGSKELGMLYNRCTFRELFVEMLWLGEQAVKVGKGSTRLER